MGSTFGPLPGQIETVLYTAAHGGFSGQTVPLGGGAAIANLLAGEWSRSKLFELKLLGPSILGPSGPSAREIVSFNEHQYAAFCNSFRKASTQKVLEHDPACTAVLVNDISEGPEFELIARAGFRIVTIYHVDVVAYIAAIYLRGLIRPETLTRWWERLRGSALGCLSPTILRLIFEQQRASLLWSERVVVPSAGMKEIMLRCYPDTPPDRIEILPWGCPPAFGSSVNRLEPGQFGQEVADTPLTGMVPAGGQVLPMPENQVLSVIASAGAALPKSPQVSVSEVAASSAPPSHDTSSPPPAATSQRSPSLDSGDAGTAALRTEYGIEPGARILLCLSRISAEKGHDFVLKTLLEWEGALSFPSVPVWLFICGEPAFMNGRRYSLRLATLAARLKKVRVVFPGYVTGNRKRAFFRLSDLYLFPSSHESYGLTLMEALGSGLPAISRDHAGARQILTPEFGVVVRGSGRSARLEFRHALETLLGDDSMRSSMALAAARWAQARPFSESAGRLAELLARPSAP